MNKVKSEKNTFKNRLRTMLSVDLRRMFTMPFLYFMVGISFIMLSALNGCIFEKYSSYS